MPSQPTYVYAEEFKRNNGWYGFLGNMLPQNRFLSYEKASLWAQKEGIVTSTQWRERNKKGFPYKIPADPSRIYKQQFKENNGWHGFLNSKKVYGISKIEMILRHVLEDIFEERYTGLRPNITDVNGKNHKVDVLLASKRLIIEYDGSKWHENKNQKDQNKSVSLQNSGWTVIRVRSQPLAILCPLWNISVDGKQDHSLQVFQVLKHFLFLHQNKHLLLEKTILNRLKKWTFQRLENTNFRKILKKYDEFFTYEQASIWAQNEKIKSQSEWIKRCRQGSIPPGIPLSPNHIYSREFKSKDGWYGFLNKPSPNKHLKYEEASRWAQEQKIVSVKQWRKYIKQGLLPIDIPSAPDQVYEEFKSNNGWYGFLGKKSPEPFWTYTKVSKWAQNEKIKSQSDWRKRCHKGLPSGIPADPNRTFSKEFTINNGWYGFLAKKRPSENFCTYKEASLWAQIKGITSRQQWYEMRRKEKFPPEIPSSPDKAYRKDFETNNGWYGFFGKDKPNNKK